MEELQVHEKVFRVNEEIPRMGEGDIVELRDGRLLLAYSEFYGGTADHSAARVAARISKDGGLSWSPPFELQPNVGGQNVMSTSLARLSNGRIAFLYLVKNSNTDLHAYLRTSGDESSTWSEPICATPEPGYHVVNNDRLVQLKGGRLIVPACTYPNIGKRDRNWSTVFFSDDDGLTWARSKSMLSVKGSKSGMQEPGVIELKDESLLMIMRCDLGFIYQSRSSDGGLTWSKPEATSLVAPVSPATIKRIPKTGDLLVIWNDREGHPESEPFSRRTPLTCAISRDEGETWTGIKNLEEDRDRTYCYTSVTFVGEKAILTYYISEKTSDGERVLANLKLKVLDQDWFYRDG
jgi:sialidase-1